MAGTGNGNRFASVNLNKSYGSVLHHNQSNNGGYGLGRGRGGGGGGGMVVLSRPRSSHKAAPKLSVPPPLNLPSLRKEHEKFDTLGAGSGAGGAGGGGVRPSSSGIGWSKPSGIVAVEKDEGSVGVGGDGTEASEGVKVNDVVSRGSSSTSAYLPPSARGDANVAPPVEKVSVLRGEDFPSLRATLNAANGQTQKQKDSGSQKQKHGASEELSGGLKDGLQASSQVSIRPQPQVQSSQYSVDNGQHVGNSRSQDQVRKHDDIFPGPLPLVRLNPRSDWADDERDTSHGLSSSRDHGYSRTEAYWDRDFDFPRSSFLPHKPAQYQYDRRGQRDDDVGKGLSNEVSNVDPFVRAPSREGGQGHPWRTSAAQDVVTNRNNLGAWPVNVNLEVNKQNKYVPPQFGGTSNIHSGRQPWNNPVEPNIGRGADRNFQQRFVSDSNRYRVDSVQNNMGGRPSFSSSNKGSSGYQLPNFSRDKRSFSKSEKPYVEDPFLNSTSFDGEDPFSGGILGVVKRKKDSNITLDFHDPVRESFEAELERIQQLQEQERLRVVEEQERAVEMARREEEERERVVREQKDRQRRLEEAAREAAWKAEQEKVEVMRRAEELKIAKEEEKQRMMMEEERRKQAAKQKLLELEERIARRQAVSPVNSGDTATCIVKERDLSKPDDFASWEDGERMVERITNSASSDSSLSRPFDLRPRAGSDRDGSFAFTDRGKSFNSWRRDMFESGNSSSFFSVDHENGHLSPRREAAIGGRSFPRKDLYGGQGYTPNSGHYRGGVPEPHMDDFPHARGHRWNICGDGDPYGRNMEFETDFDVGWGQGHIQGQGPQGRGRGYSPFPDRLYDNSDLDEFYSYERSRYPARQPRVLPPPALSSVHQTSFRSENDCLGSSSYEGGNVHFNHALKDDTSGNFQNMEEENSDIVDVQEERDANEEQELNKRNALGCDSQSSLSVSSPPGSPTQLSHDDFDESRDSLAVTGVTEGQDISLSENEADHVEGKGNTVPTASSLSGGDDEEWTVENIAVSHDQEDCEEDEVYGEEGENGELTREFEEMHVEERGSSDMTDMVLGFDQGVEVGIPNDDNLHVGTQESVNAMNQNESFDSLGDSESLQVADTLADETENALQDHVSESDNASTHDPRLLNPSTADSSCSTHAHQSVPSSILKTDSQSSNQTGLSVGGGGTQGPVELPKLQFGLFSGPSLIPSPVPAIQIGSIQMPLQLHPHIGPPLPHMHSSQPPLFQFGQLRYPPPPMSQGILSLAPQPMSSVQDSSSLYSVKKDETMLTMGSFPIQLSNQLSVSQETDLKEANLMAAPSAGSNVLSRENQVEPSTSAVDTVRPQFGRRTNNFTRNPKPLLNNGAAESRPQARNSSFCPAFNGRNSGGPAAHQFPANRGRKFATRNSDSRLDSPSNEAHSDVNGYQRRPRRVTQRFEFRVRQTADDKQSRREAPSNYDAKDSGAHHKSGLNKEIQSGRPTQASNWSSDKFSTREPISVIGEEKPARKHAATNVPGACSHVEGSLKRIISSENDVDAPLQSGVVRVYEQRGIEAPSDEDDFIEVRSKRQMLNDRREQREKENKAKSSNMRKLQHKSRPTPQAPSAARNTNRTSDLSNAQVANSTRSAVSSNRGLLNNEVSAAMNNIVSQPLALVGTASLSADSSTNTKASVKSVQRGSHTSAERTVRADNSNLTSDGPAKVVGVQSTSGSWGGSCTNQSVMSLTQTQLEAAMEPACFDINVGAIGDQSDSVSEAIMPSPPVNKVTSFSSAASPISSLLAGEKIQFGAVTSPTTSPASAHVVPQGIRRSALSSLDIRTSQCNPTSENNCDNLFEKDKHLNESCGPLEDCEAAAAASAIAVAAIGNDEVVGSKIGTAAIDGMSGGIARDQRTDSQSKAEETLSVSLPADLSVETPPISIWPPLPSPHSTSSQMQFPGGPTSHFPFYDMNPLMGGPVFAFGPRDESAGPPSHTQKSNAPCSGPLGTWQQCHTGVDSLYRPAGFTAPFINPPPGSIPGVQGPPHMVVYNHFASVGQFGQVGLSYMGTTYVPSGKQPDWKHNPTSTAMGGGEGDINNVNMVPVLRNATNIPGQVSHLPPGSPLLSMASPLAMYEVSPFQSSPDMSIHPRWSPVPTSSVQTIPQSLPLQQQQQQQQADGPLLSPFGQGSSDHPSSTTNGFSMGPNAGSTQFSSEPEPENLARTDSVVGGAVSKRNSQATFNVPHKAQLAPQKNASGQQQYSHYQRGAGPRNGSGADWSSRKPGFRGRNYSSGGERTFPPPTKVKQIYVAKQTTSGTSTDL